MSWPFMSGRSSPSRLGHFRPCWLSWCLRRSTFLWKPLEQISQPKGLKPVCLRLCVMRLELWLNALPHTWHLCGFSPVQVIETQNITRFVYVKNTHMHRILRFGCIMSRNELKRPQTRLKLKSLLKINTKQRFACKSRFSWLHWKRYSLPQKRKLSQKTRAKEYDQICKRAIHLLSYVS